MIGPPVQPERPRWRRRLAAAAAIAVLFLGGAVALAPLLVDSAAVRTVIEREVSARVGGKVRYDSIQLRLFPVPRAEIRGVTVQVPDLVTGRAAVLSVKLSLSALLSRTVRPTAIRVEEPVVEIRPLFDASDFDPGKGQSKLVLLVVAHEFLLGDQFRGPAFPTTPNSRRSQPDLRI